MNKILITDNLCKIYKSQLVVNRVNLEIEEGSIYGLIGKNGAGKTTLMRMIVGLAIPDRGSMTLFENSDLNLGRSRIGCVIENPALFLNMSARDNLRYYCIYKGIKDNTNEVIDTLLDMVSLEPYDDRKTKFYSLGMKQRLAIAIALIGNPKFLVLDEPINGLDPTGIREVRDIILDLNKKYNITFLISSHILGELEKIATHYGIINYGKLINQFSREELNNIRGNQITLRIDNIEQALSILSSQYDASLINVDNNIITLSNIQSTGSQVNELLATNGLYAESIQTNMLNLEDYFVEQLGGNKSC